MFNRFDRNDPRYQGRDDQDRWGNGPMNGPMSGSGMRPDWHDRDEGSYRGASGMDRGRFGTTGNYSERSEIGASTPWDRSRYGGQHSFAGSEHDWRDRGQGDYPGWASQRDYGNYGNGPWGAQVERTGTESGGGWQSSRFPDYGAGRRQGMNGGMGGMGMGSREPGWGRSEMGADGTNDRTNRFFGAGGGDAYGRQEWGGPQRGQYFGKGPKGYRRSDERIREDVSERLSLGHIDASEIEVQVKDGEVTLTGTVPTREMKRMAEEMVEHLSGVHDVANQLRVKREEPTSMDRSTATNDTGRKGAGSQTYGRS